MTKETTPYMHSSRKMGGNNRARETTPALPQESQQHLRSAICRIGNKTLLTLQINFRCVAALSNDIMDWQLQP